MKSSFSAFRKLTGMAMLLFLMPLAMKAQTRVTIYDSGELYSTYSFADNESSAKELKKKVGDDMYNKILASCTESAWPKGITTLESRNQNRDRIKSYVAYLVARFDNDNMIVLRIPAKENSSMPANMRSDKDFFFIMAAAAIVDASVSAPMDNTVKSDDNADEEVVILNPMELYSTYNLKGDSAARALIVSDEGLNEDEYMQLCILANEESWPTGLKTFDLRTKWRDEMKKYKAYMAAEFVSNGKPLMLVYIPKKGNEHMPAEMQPPTEMGFYVVFNRVGVEYKKGK